MIKKIDKCDIPRCVKVITESFQTVADELGFTIENAPRFTAFAVDEEMLLWHYQNEYRLMYGYYEDDKIIGYYSIKLLEKQECELNHLCVLPEFRHRKIGEELLQNAIATARNESCVRMNIGIVEENTVLRKWYEKHGFLYQGKEKFDFFPFTCGYMYKIL